MCSFRASVRLVLLSVCLFAALPAYGQGGLFPEPAGGLYEETPNVFVKLEAVSAGLSYPHLFAVELARLTVTAYGVRAGVSFGEGYGFIFVGGGAGIPVRVGYTILSRPTRMAFMQCMFPEVYAEVSTAFWNTSMVPFVRGSVYAGIEGFGLGAGLEAGVMSLGWDRNFDPHTHQYPIERRTGPYIALRVKLLALTVGF